MPKTSIDGLPVRSSRAKTQVSHVSSHKVVSDIRRASGSQAEASRHDTAAEPWVPSSTQNSASDDFLSPVQTLDMEKSQADSHEADDPYAEIGDLSTMDEATWEELLDGFGDAKPTKPGEGDSSEAGAQRKRRTRGKVRRPRIFTKRSFPLRHPLLSTILILLVSLGIGLFVWGDGLVSRLTNGNSGLWDVVGAMFAEEVPFETDANGRTNVLVFGTEGYDMDGSSGDGKHDGAQLTDSIMVISFDQETRDVAMISLPRDLRVTMACSAGKINEVFWCHNRNGDDDAAGAAALMAQLETILGIQFQYWAHVNWGSLVQIVDTIGGVTVTLDEDINDKYYTGMIIKAGVPTTLTGIEAVALARARHGTQGGDFTRGNSQQKIVEGIVTKLVEQGVNLSEAFSLVSILGDNLRSNFSSDNIKAGVRLIAGFNPAAMRTIPLVDYGNGIYYVKTAMINGISYVIPSAGETNYLPIQNYIAQTLSSNAAVREGATISIYNGTGESGVAGNESALLEADGFVVDHVGDAEVGVCTERYCVYSNGAKPETQAALEQRYNVAAQGIEMSPVDAGTDIIIVIGATE